MEVTEKSPRYQVPVTFTWDPPVVELLHHSPIDLLIRAIRTTTHTVHLVGSARDEVLIREIFERAESPLEHVYYTFEIKHLSRAALQELARHRIASLSVESTRFALKKIVNKSEPVVLRVVSPEDSFELHEFQKRRLLERVDELYRLLHVDGHRNDLVKPLIPEALTTRLIWTINARSLKNFLNLRLSPKAYAEMRMLAAEVYEEVRKVHPELWETWILEE